MRIAIVSDIHANRTAFEAVLADLRQTSPDLVLHGGDLADGGGNPAEIVDYIRDLGWPGVAGNGEEALTEPETLEAFAAHSQAPASLWTAVREMMAATRDLLGKDRLQWLHGLSHVQFEGEIALVHASPENACRSPGLEATDAELQMVYDSLSRPIAVYGHIHRPFIRTLSEPDMLVANAGSVGLPYDGDSRAAYLLIDDSRPVIRRVEYDIDRELKAITSSRFPHSDWLARTLRSASPRMP
jgi:predicted phosphodiesterase